MSQATLSPARVPTNPVQQEHTSEYRQPRYLPTPEEIARETAKIRKEWTEAEEELRRIAIPGLHFHPIQTHCNQCGDRHDVTNGRFLCQRCEAARAQRIRYGRKAVAK